MYEYAPEMAGFVLTIILGLAALILWRSRRRFLSPQAEALVDAESAYYDMHLDSIDPNWRDRRPETPEGVDLNENTKSR